jgi:DUF2075 family protein
VSYGWLGSVSEFLALDRAALGRVLSARHLELQLSAASFDQEKAWHHELECLARSFATRDDAGAWGIVLEYELPFEGGRRADAIILAGQRVVALEFKDAPAPVQASIDQALAYARDLSEYHVGCRGLDVIPVLAMPRTHGLDAPLDGGRLVSCENLPSAIRASAAEAGQIEASAWAASRYEPLPSLVEAARLIFRDKPLPHIRRAESAGVPALLAYLHALVRSARDSNERHLVLVTGVPGSGKTLLGLQFVHESESQGAPDAIFLSGNDPLVDVLQDALESKVFVRRMHNYILDFGVRQKPMPPYHVVVFDEAQRAWDEERMRLKKAHPRSEPEILMQLASTLPGWAVVVGLVGEGQEIYVGEEAGLDQWRAAVEKAGPEWRVHVPNHLESQFGGLPLSVRPALNLTLSLRTHRAERAQEWFRALLLGDVPEAARVSRALEGDYDIYVATDLAVAKRYIRGRYSDQPGKRYGLLASSMARNLRQIGVDNEWGATQRLKVARWFNAPQTDPASCCQLEVPVTEFQCQGLELDMPLLCWGDDLGWEGEWVPYRRRKAAIDSFRLLINTYRVLLSRGRDGLVVFLPPTMREGQRPRMLELLTEAGVKRLPSDPSA